MMKAVCTTLLVSTFFVVVHASELHTLLVSNSSMFDKCETNICFVFRDEKPIVNLDPQMRSSQQQNLFRCRDRSRIYPGLTGPFLDLVDEIPELWDSYCIWAGPNTTFDGMVDFVRYVSSGERSLKFVVGGMLFQMSYRISNGSIPSASISGGKIVIVSENRRVRRAFSDAMKSIVGPFGQGTWWLLSGFILLFAAVYILINYCFITNTRLETMCNAMLEPLVPRHWLLGSDIDDVVEKGNERETRLFLIRGWKAAAMLFFVISALFYEIGIVAFVTDNIRHVLPFMLRNMGEKKLKKFIVNNGSAFESILRDLALPEALSQNPKPWQTVKTFDAVFDTLSGAKGAASYCLSSDQTALYELNNRGLCTKLAIKDPTDPIPDYTAVWYYSSHVGLPLRTVLDQRISRLREQGRIQKLMELSVGKFTLTCGLSRNSISIFVLLSPLMMVLGPFFLSILGVLFVRWILKRRASRIVNQMDSEGSVQP